MTCVVPVLPGGAARGPHRSANRTKENPLGIRKSQVDKLVKAELEARHQTSFGHTDRKKTQRFVATWDAVARNSSPEERAAAEAEVDRRYSS